MKSREHIATFGAGGGLVFKTKQYPGRDPTGETGIPIRGGGPVSWKHAGIRPMSNPTMKKKILNEIPSGRCRNLPYAGWVSIPNKPPRVDSKPKQLPRRKRYHPALSGLGLLLLANLACRPVLTIGWQEIGILILLLAFLLGPALFRLARRWEEFRSWKDRKDKQPPSD